MTYQFPDRPAAKSSTNVLTGATACQVCGCRKVHSSMKAGGERPGCQCRCHKEKR